MENTHKFVEKLHANQLEDEKNRKRQVQGEQAKKLPSKHHSTNK